MQVEQEVRDARALAARRDRSAPATPRSRRGAPTWSTPSGRSRPIGRRRGPRGSRATRGRSRRAGSLKSWHHTSSLRTIGGRKRRRCSSLPCANSAGAARLRPSGFSRPRLNGASSCSTRRATAGDTSSPPYATGHVGTTSPELGEHRIPRLVVGARAARRAPRPHRRPRPASIHGRGTLRLDPRAHRVDHFGFARSALRSPHEVGRVTQRPRTPVPDVRGTQSCPHESRRVRDDSSSANASLRSCCSSDASRPACNNHFVSPSVTVGPEARFTTRSATVRSRSAAGTLA